MFNDSKYKVAFEVAGPLAMFARPDTGGTPTSYPAPTWSAAKALFESIAFLADGAAWICPVRVELCRRVSQTGGRLSYHRYTNNYGGPLRKVDLFNKGPTAGGSSMQLFATILTNVCYRLHGVVIGSGWKAENDPRHYLQNLFHRRLQRGQCFRTPCLGWSEFTCSYWGPFREGITEVDTELSIEVPSMLTSIWSDSTNGKYAPVFSQNVRIEAGVLVYPLSLGQRNELATKENPNA